MYGRFKNATFKENIQISHILGRFSPYLSMNYTFTKLRRGEVAFAPPPSPSLNKLMTHAIT